MSEEVSVGADGEVSLSKPPVRVTRVIDRDRRRDLPRYTHRGAAGRSLSEGYQGIWGFCETLTGVKFFMSSGCGGGNVSVSYFPEFTALDSRDSALPFASSLDDVVVAWTVKLIENGRRMDFADMANVLGAPVNSLVQYFEGQAEECWTGEGPW